MKRLNSFSDLLRAGRAVGSYKRASLLADGIEGLADFVLKMDKEHRTAWLIPVFLCGAVGAMHAIHMYYYHGWSPW